MEWSILAGKRDIKLDAKFTLPVTIPLILERIDEPP